MRRATTLILLAWVAVGVLLAAAVFALGVRSLGDPVASAGAGDRRAGDTEAERARGEYLVRAGNCATCHTVRGGEPFAGGRAIDTPFGTVFASNITPDEQTGIGRWSADDFWQALHLGRSRSGRLLYPAFPYPSFTLVSREDADAMYAYLRSVRAVEQPNRPHALRVPYDSQAALAVWRALYFRPGRHVADAARSEAWNRGAYLVRGLGHCSACHASRNLLGASRGSLELSGGLIPMQGWYAPSLSAPDEAGVAHWDIPDVVRLLGSGVARNASVMGPMAEVVYRSMQYLSEDDLRAIATYLKALPEPARRAEPMRATAPTTVQFTRGRAIYEKRCSDCHGPQGQGEEGRYPALAGNRAVTMAEPANVIRVVLSGGFPPGTRGNPRPYGMPPFQPFLSDAEVADVVSYVRSAWGNAAAPVDALTVAGYRGVRSD